MIRCRILGHSYRFTSEDVEMRWNCGRCGAEGGSKSYPSAEQATRYARAFDREDHSDLGRRAPLVGLLPLRIARAFRRDQRPG
jgi:hypothetical protein